MNSIRVAWVLAIMFLPTSKFVKSQETELDSIVQAFGQGSDILELTKKVDGFPLEKIAKQFVEQGNPACLGYSVRGRMICPGVLRVPTRGFRPLVHFGCVLHESFETSFQRQLMADPFALKFNLLTKHFIELREHGKPDERSKKIIDNAIRMHYHFSQKQWDEFSLTTKIMLRYTLGKKQTELNPDASKSNSDLNEFSDSEIDR